MALKQFYTSETEIPTEFKDHYVLKDGKYELAVEGINSISGVLAKNTELLGNQKTDKAEIDRQTAEVARLNGEIGKLSGDLSKAQAGAVPNGYVAVSKKDKEVIDALVKQNLKPEDVLNDLKDLPALRAKVSESELEKSIAVFAEAEKVQNVKALTRLIKQDGVLPQVKEVEENGKKIQKGFLVKKLDDDKTEEKSYTDYKTANWGEFIHSLDQTAQPYQPGNAGDPPPFRAATDTEADTKAQSAQASAVRRTF